MYTLNAHYWSQPFQLFGHTLAAQAFRENMRNGFEAFVTSYKTNQPMPVEEISIPQDEISPLDGLG